MTSFLDKTQNFITEFDGILEKKRAAWVKFVAAFPAETVESSLGTYIARLPHASDMYWLLAGVLQTKLTPEFSDAKNGQQYCYTRYSRFNVWFLGATKGLELVHVRSFLDESYKNDEACEVCWENNREFQGHLSTMNISTMTALYIVFQSIPLNPSLVAAVQNLKETVQQVRKELKYFQDCEDGNCITKGDDDDDTGCNCNDEYDAANNQASKDAAEFLDLLFEKSVQNPDGYFQSGLEPYIIHQASSVDDKKGFCVMRQPADEAKEKERLAEQKRVEDEKKEKYERERLEKEIKQQKKAAENSKKRLAELNHKVAKKKISK